MSTAKIAFTADELKEVLAAAIAEARKPVVTDKEIKATEQANKMRAQNADLVKQEMANRAALKQNCSHIRRDGSTRAVCVKAKEGPYMICQFCQAIVRPGNKAKNDATDDIYNTDLFNKLFQMAGAADMFL